MHGAAYLGIEGGIWMAWRRPGSDQAIQGFPAETGSADQP